MGYHTDFSGEFRLTPVLTPEQVKVIQAFNEARHEEQEQEELGLDYSYYCQWTTDDAGATLFWDQGEKFYDYIRWLAILIEKFFEPWGVSVNGEVIWEGEDSSDLGKIIVKDNEVTIKCGVVRYDLDGE